MRSCAFLSMRMWARRGSSSAEDWGGETALETALGKFSDGGSLVELAGFVFEVGVGA